MTKSYNKEDFSSNSRNIFWLYPLVIGLYPFLFYYSNNFSAINSWSHGLYFVMYFFGIPFVVFLLLYLLFRYSQLLRKYREQIIFVVIIVCVSALMSQAMYLTYKKKILLGILVASVLLSLKFYKNHFKIILLILLMTIIPVLKNAVHLYEHYKGSDWLQFPTDMKEVKFVNLPNVYIIQPDGYASKAMMESELYNYKSDLYAWLEHNDFKVYNNFRSNYPASLASNASTFAMKHHYFGQSFFNTLEVPNARDVIVGDNPVIDTFKKNGYSTYFVVQDEYFQQNRSEKLYDYYNIDLSEIPYFSNDNNVKKVVLDDLKVAMEKSNGKGAKFFFVEKLLPHHIHFVGPRETRIEEERKSYLEKIEEVNVWLKETVNYISKKDPEAIIAVMADHGGWVGIANYQEMYTTENPDQIKSIYGSLLAIKWNGNMVEGYDTELTSSVNFFRILFANLSQSKSLLTNLEDDSSYNLHYENSFYNSVYQVINDKGEFVFNKK